MTYEAHLCGLQNLPLPYKMVLGGPSETFPWHLSSRTFRSELKLVYFSDKVSNAP